MPGIVGLITTAPTDAENRTKAQLMLSTMMHERAYKAGAYQNQSAGVYAGWVVHGEPFTDSMPIVSERSDRVLLFSGEHFSDKHCRHAKAHGVGGDVRSLLRVHDATTPDFLRALNGWFSGLVVDIPQSRVTLFNDRVGLGRVYYYQSDEAFYFASEAKALLRICPELREIDPQGVAEFFTRDCVLENRTLFKNIRLLPGGSAWVFERGRLLTRASYFSPSDWERHAVDTSMPGPQLVERLRKVFVDILPRYLEPAGKVGLSLTGGLDSRLIVAAAPEAHALTSYTFAGERDTFDVRQSRKVARTAGMAHQVLRLQQEFFRDFEKLAEETVYISDGTLGPSGAHNLYFNRLARDIAPVRLTGLFGSEILRQGRICPRVPQVEPLLSADLLEHVHAADRLVERYRSEHSLTATLHRDIVWRGYGGRAIEQSQVTLRSPFVDNDLVELMYTVPSEHRRSVDVQQAVIKSLNESLWMLMSSRGHNPKRHPVVRQFIKVFLWALFKADYLYFFATPAWMMKAEPVIDFLGIRHLLGHHKFEHYRVWYRNGLCRYVSDILLDSKTQQRPFLDRTRLRNMVGEHLDGKANHFIGLDKALGVELTIRTMLETFAHSQPRLQPGDDLWDLEEQIGGRHKEHA
jgi:asparagine synthase (glutamine-hydrolysing)